MIRTAFRTGASSSRRTDRAARQHVLAAPKLRHGLADPTFSFIIPCYNEAEDIAETIAAAASQRIAAREIIVVDGGSSDGTLEVLRPLAATGQIHLIEEGARRGVAAARNTGIARATSDVVVILNADVRPAPDFIELLSSHYRAGYDAVSVQSRVENAEDATGRYLQAEHQLCYGDEASVGWTEGFSARRDVALAAGFPEQIPGAGGEDVVFFDRLSGADIAWTCDFSIVVPHRVPATLRGFWHQWRSRGNAVPYADVRLRRRSLRLATARRVLAAAYSLALAILLVPGLVAAARRARRSPRGLRDLPAFWLLLHVQRAAHRYGEWQSIITLWRSRR